MKALEALDLAEQLVGVATKVPSAIAAIRSYVEGSVEQLPDVVLVELPDLTRNHIEQARIERLAAGGASSA